MGQRVSEGTSLSEEEIKLLIDYHDNQASGAEAMEMSESSAYHDERAAHFKSLLTALKR